MHPPAWPRESSKVWPPGQQHGVTWGLVTNAHSQALHKPTQSELLGVEPHMCLTCL